MSTPTLLPAVVGQHSSTPLPQADRFLDYDKSLACIHCGLCLGSCPTYLETGNENDSPRGRIYLMRAMQDGRLPVGGDAVRHIDLCLGCRACEAVCPSGVQYGDLLEHTRDHIEKTVRRSLFQTFLRRIAIEQVFPFPWRMKLALVGARLTRWVPKFLVPKFLRDSMSLLPDKFSSQPLPEFSPGSPIPNPQSPVPHKRVAFVSGCVMSVMFGETNANSVKLLNRAGHDVVTPREQVCCGALYAHSGSLDKARECARRNIEAFEKTNVDLIVINAAGCGSTLKEYDKLLHDDPAWAERAKAFTAKVRDLVEVLSPQPSALSSQNSILRPPSSVLVTYHDACHLAHPQHITKQPRELIKAIVGKNFVELPESDVCCGSAGSYNLTEPEMAERLQKRKIDNILKTGAQIVVTTNPGCLLQIRAGLAKAAPHVRVLHIADFLAGQALR